MRAVAAVLLLAAACSSPSPAPKDPPAPTPVAAVPAPAPIAAPAPAPAAPPVAAPPAEAPPSDRPVVKVRSGSADGSAGRPGSEVRTGDVGVMTSGSVKSMDIPPDALAKFTGLPKTVTLGENPGLSRNDIDRVIKANAAAFRACYQNALAHKPTLAGKITTHFVVAFGGNVTSATIVAAKSTLTDETVAACIVGEFKKLEFPLGGATVNYPMIFSSGG